MTVVDALSTAIIMEKEHFVAKMLDHISKIDFTTTAKENDAISLFETNIRYLAGLLSGMPCSTPPSPPSSPLAAVGAGRWPCATRPGHGNLHACARARS